MISKANAKNGAIFSRLFKFLLFPPDINLSDFIDLIPPIYLSNSKHFPIEDIRQFSYLKSSIGYFLKYDDFEALQSVSQRPDFNFNSTLIISPFDLPSVMTTQKISYLAVAAFYGSTHAFNFLFLNSATINSVVCDSSIAGGNSKIIIICMQKYGFTPYPFPYSIIFHRNEIADFLLVNYVPHSISYERCIRSLNIGALSYLLGNGFDVNLPDI
jgi:hypothetical protein